MKIVTFIITLLLCFGLSATEDQITFASDQQKATYLETVVELRCPKCQNQNIADSNAVVAKDMRVKVKALLDEGKNKDEVIDYMVNRYGQFVHYQPPFNVATSLLWFLPLGFIIFAVFMQVNRSKLSRLSGNTQTDNSASPQDNASSVAQSNSIHSNSTQSSSTKPSPEQANLDQELAQLLTSASETEQQAQTTSSTADASIQDSKDNK